MTTEARSADGRPGPGAGVRLLPVTGGVTAVAGVLGAAVAAGLAGPPAAAGVLVGTTLTVLLLLGGSLALDLVASALPAASLLVALLTYTLQLAGLLAALIVLERSGLLGGTLDRAWLGGTVIVATLAWTALLLRTFRRARVPAYDPPATEPGPHGREGGR